MPPWSAHQCPARVGRAPASRRPSRGHTRVPNREGHLQSKLPRPSRVALRRAHRDTFLQAASPAEESNLAPAVEAAFPAVSIGRPGRRPSESNLRLRAGLSEYRAESNLRLASQKELAAPIVLERALPERSPASPRDAQDLHRILRQFGIAGPGFSPGTSTRTAQILARYKGSSVWAASAAYSRDQTSPGNRFRSQRAGEP